MGLILLEALLAGLVLVVIVWWTMFSGRHKGELPQAQAKPSSPADEASRATTETPSQPPSDPAR